MAGIALAPVMLVVAASIVLTNPGPVLYSQTRTGLGGRHFTMFKFRTMRSGAETGGSPIWAVTNDTRCTRLGAWLRRSGFDELPQLWNVLRGDMSVVGPRPERPEFVKQFTKEHEGYLERQIVPAGLTGYAQVHGWRGDTDMGERIRHDRYYVRHWSLAMDLRILLATLRYGWSERTRDGVTN